MPGTVWIPTPADFYDQISRGAITGYVPWGILGYNGDVDIIAGGEDIWPVGGLYTWPAAAQQMELVSTSVEDDPDKGAGVPGTGVHAVTLHYLNAAGVEFTEDITLNGTTVVTTTAVNIFRVQYFVAKTVGTTGAAVGDVSIRNLADTPVYGRISATMTSGRSMIWRVPAGKVLFITSVTFSIAGVASGKDGLFTCRATYNGLSDLVTTQPMFFPFGELYLADSGMNRPIEIPVRLPAGVDIKATVSVGTDNAVVAACWRGYLQTL